jgi:hypothetical protein
MGVYNSVYVENVPVFDVYGVVSIVEDYENVINRCGENILKITENYLYVFF